MATRVDARGCVLKRIFNRLPGGAVDDGPDATSAAVIVAALERAGLVTQTRHGREQRVRGDVATLGTAHRLLDDLEALWRGRIDRIEQVLAQSTGRAPR